MIAATKLMVREIVDGFEIDPEPRQAHPERHRPGLVGDSPDPTRTSDRGRSGLVLAWGRVQYEKGFQVLARAVGACATGWPGSNA